MENPERWQKVKHIVGAALEREPVNRAPFLEEACGHDKSLRAEVESLLSAYEKSMELSGPALGGNSAVDDSQERRFIDPYQLIRKLGEGGMGEVWLAEQTAPVWRPVALKLIRSGLYDKAVLQRFQSERQSLAIMDHPAIAKVFDAGATTEGQPYFVMEFVAGLPITDYCDQKKMKIRERLGLFVQVCEGVQHAHQKAIIHRDLKPANILVVEVDGKPMPRIIDFGLAKAITPPIPGETLFTQAGSFLGTPGYMSPEQADPRVQDVDTRTDVYSLGMVLYELLTGTLPFDTKQWKEQPLDEVLRQLREEDPPRPSAKFTADRAASTPRAEARGTEPKQLASVLHGDLDWITMKAVEKDRGRRYESPSELAADIRRSLSHEPVVARPASSSYRLQKYVRRHRVGVSVAAGLVFLLAGFAVLQAVQLRRITRERDRASRITDFMTGMFKVSNPSEARGNSITAREVLDKASKDIDAGLAKDPDLQAQMMDVMGQVYDNLGLYARAQTLLQQAVDIRRRVLGPENPDTLRSMSNLSRTLDHQGHYAEAESLIRQTLDTERKVLGPEHLDTVWSISNLGVSLTRDGRYADAEKLLREALDTRRRVLGPEHPQTLVSMSNLAAVLADEHQFVEAEKLLRDTVAVKRRVLGADNPDTIVSQNNLGSVLNSEGKYAEAEKLFQETLDTRRRVLGPEHPQTLLSMLNLADTLTKMGQYDEAQKMLQQTLEIQRRVLGPEHPYTAVTTYNLGSIAGHLGHRDEALALLRTAVDHGLPVGVALGMDKDTDLQSLQGDPRFDALVAYARQHAAALPKPK
jgi:eukaryotic-like serine/threonine-protein kinase